MTLLRKDILSAAFGRVPRCAWPCRDFAVRLRPCPSTVKGSVPEPNG